MRRSAKARHRLRHTKIVDSSRRPTLEDRAVRSRGESADERCSHHAQSAHHSTAAERIYHGTRKERESPALKLPNSRKDSTEHPGGRDSSSNAPPATVLAWASPRKPPRHRSPPGPREGLARDGWNPGERPAHDTRALHAHAGRHHVQPCMFVPASRLTKLQSVKSRSRLVSSRAERRSSAGPAGGGPRR